MPHYFDSQHSDNIKYNLIRWRFKNIDFEFISANEVFSHKEVDRGTQVLIESTEIKENSSILDLGCGYGVVGIVFAKLFPKSKVTMVDINKRAIDCAKRNIQKYNLKNCIAIESNLYEKLGDEKFDYILVNPPFTAGREICYKIIDNSKDFLKEDGKLLLVSRKNKGAFMLKKRMLNVFSNVEQIARKSGYYVYLSVNNR